MCRFWVLVISQLVITIGVKKSNSQTFRFHHSFYTQQFPLIHSQTRYFMLTNTEYPLVARLYYSFLKDKRIIGEKPFKCDQCPSAFNWNYKLVAHKRLHTGFDLHIFQNLKTILTTGEKPFECNQCSKAFADMSRLKTHNRIHTSAI